jgi:hypothetical protein
MTTHTRQLTTIHTRHLKIQHVEKVNRTTVRQYCIQFPYFSPTHTVLALSPQPFTSHHFTTHINVSHKDSFLPPSLHFTSLHFASLLDDFSLHFTSFLCTFRRFATHFILLYLTSIITLLTLFLKIFGLQRRVPNTSADNQFRCWMVLFTKEYFPISVLCLLLLIFLS